MSVKYVVDKLSRKMPYFLLYAIISHFLKGVKKARNTPCLQTKHAMSANLAC